MDGGERMIPGVAFVACAYTTSVPGTHIAWLFKKRKLFIFHVLVYLYIQLSVHFSFKLIWEKKSATVCVDEAASSNDHHYF